MVIAIGPLGAREEIRAFVSLGYAGARSSPLILVAPSGFLGDELLVGRMSSVLRKTLE